MTASRKRQGGGRAAPKKKGSKKGTKAEAKEKVGEGDDMEVEEDPKDIDDHPYAVGHSLIVSYRDGSERLAKIIERTSENPEKDRDAKGGGGKGRPRQGQGNDGDGGDDDDDDDEPHYRYYVHYEDFNRRMDEWVETKRIQQPPSVANPRMEAIEEATHEVHTCIPTYLPTYLLLVVCVVSVVYSVCIWAMRS